MITPTDINDLRYFALIKGDIERWYLWEDKREDFMAEYPELIHAYDALKLAESTWMKIVGQTVEAAKKE